MRRLVVAIGLVGLGVTGLVLGAPTSVATTVEAVRQPLADSGTGTATGTVNVFQATGLLDKVLADRIGHAIDEAANTGAQALIIQLNSNGAVIGRDGVAALADRMRVAKIPIAVWVGPAGARATGASGQLMLAAAATGMAPASRVGRFGEPLSLAGGPIDLGAAGTLRDRTANATEARDLGLIRNTLNEATVPTLRSMVLALDGLTWNGTTVHTAHRTVASDGTARTDLSAPVRLAKLGLIAQLFHTVSSPPVAYLLTVIGLCLLVFEFFTAGVGVAGVVGALAVVFGSVGVAALPVRGGAYALLVVSILAFAVDVQTGVPRLWTGIGVVTFVIASLLLYRGGLHLSWVALLTGIAGVLLAFVTGMPSMVRTRFATPTIGREWMIGSFGEAVTWVDPEGIVQIGDGKWRARTNRATPIDAGNRVRVVAIDGVTLEVEPETGAARDYRERSRS